MQRIGAGELRGRKLMPVPTGVPGLRPTAAKVREAVFDRIGGEIVGAHVLDLFAGSGALSIEALSRGATSATLCELDPRVARHLGAQLAALGLRARAEVVRADVRTWIVGGRAARTPFDVVFVDPPFATPLVFADVVQALVTASWLAPAALVVCERERVRGEAPHMTYPEAMVLEATRTYGQVAIEYLRAP